MQWRTFMQASLASGLEKTNKQPLTERQKEVLEFVRVYVEKYAMPPTRQEIADAFGFMVNAAQGHLEAIEKKGWLEIRRHAPGGGRIGRIFRGIRLL
jgi:SOS-response transcriptional repressor LexA